METSGGAEGAVEGEEANSASAAKKTFTERLAYSPISLKELILVGTSGAVVSGGGGLVLYLNGYVRLPYACVNACLTCLAGCWCCLTCDVPFRIFPLCLFYYEGRWLGYFGGSKRSQSRFGSSTEHCLLGRISNWRFGLGWYCWVLNVATIVCLVEPSVL